VNGSSELHGVLNVCKERGWTSHDVVARVRRLLATRRVGHAGTLDPLAEGVLPVVVNRATRVVDCIAAGEKSYYAEALLGVSTDTLDSDGAVVESRQVPTLSVPELNEVLARFVGPQLQVPPAYSAIRVGGRHAYDIARSGERVVLPPRSVVIESLGLAWLEGERFAIELRCSKGTYVRSLVQDIGAAIGCGAHVTRLVRTSVAGFQISEAVGLDELKQASEEGHLSDVVVPIDMALSASAALALEIPQREAMRHGAIWNGPTASADAEARAYSVDGSLLGLALQVEAGVWRPRLSLEAV
jgi:tRNA pseudouridine55 synthase